MKLLKRIFVKEEKIDITKSVNSDDFNLKEKLLLDYLLELHLASNEISYRNTMDLFLKYKEENLLPPYIKKVYYDLDSRGKGKVMNEFYDRVVGE